MEIWEDVEGYEGYYQVSNLGRVKSLARTIVRSDGVLWPVKEKILVTSFSTDGYKLCKLCRAGKYKIVGVHILVAKAFIPNPDNLPEGNHKNFVRTDNVVTNLEWSTHGDNVRYSIAAGRHFCNRDLHGKNNPNYGGTKLKQFFEEHPEEKQRLARHRGQNGRAKSIQMLDETTGDVAG